MAFTFAAVPEMPSRFVTPSAPRVPEKICVGKGDAGVKPKYEGTELTLTTVLVEVPVGMAKRRDQRRVTVSAVAIAMVVDVAAVRAVTWTETVWPGCIAEVSAFP